ncbi:Anaerobic dimethyl sulfoxide reductase chain C, anchor subunit [hydrothermal vent metagenome]|uniref:Anaerobic dimethyl sulfoxide reductase chain C, anchor subunit n=1 Tax=hydrothermal vent metagenome TaxID=652676 RepID=A0A3B0WU16_9ZZZZ
MHPAFSVIFLTTLIGVGQGLFLALYTGQLYSVIKVLPAQDSASFYGYGSLLALVFLIAGLIASFFHLGRPERAWRSAAKWKTSWLSREVIVLPAFMGMTFIYAMIHVNDWNPVLFTLNKDLIVDLSLLVGAINTVLAFSLFICTAMIYACIKFLQEWSTPLTVANYTLLGMASGFALSTAFAAYVESDLIHFYAGWTITLTVFAFITRTASLIRNTKIKYKSNLSSAIGIRHTTIKQKAQGSMGGSFNTREYFHGAKPALFKSIKWVFLVLVFVMPILLLSVALTTNTFVLFALAFVVQYAGLIAERWFFFAQANHPQNLYYQTI